MVAQGSEAVVRADVAFEAMVAALDEAGTQFVGLLRQLDDADSARPVPGLTWTAGDTAAHMLTILRRATGRDRRRAESLAGLAELNEQGVAEVATRRPGELADEMAVELHDLMDLLHSLGPDTAMSTVVKLHAGIKADSVTGLSYVLFDLLAHGHDIAAGTGRSWTIEPAHAALDLHACLPAFEPWVRPDVRDGAPQEMVLAFPADPSAIVIQVGDGSYHAQNHPARRAPAGDPVEVDPVETFMGLARRSPPITPAVQRLTSWFEPI